MPRIRRSTLLILIPFCRAVERAVDDCIPPYSHVIVSRRPMDGGCPEPTDGLTRPAGYSSSDFCWEIRNQTAPLESGTELKTVTALPEPCSGSAGSIVIGAPATLIRTGQDNEAFNRGTALLRNCELFSRMIAQRSGINVGGQRYGVSCEVLNDNYDPLQVTNATSWLAHDRRVDVLLGPYGSTMTNFAAKEAVIDNKVLLSSTGSDPNIYAEARTLAEEFGADAAPLAFGIIPKSTAYIKPAIAAVIRAAKECDDADSGCSCGGRFDSSCSESLRFGFLIEQDDFPLAACSEEALRYDVAIGEPVKAEIPARRDVASTAEHRRNIRDALEKLKEEGVSVAVICTYELGADLAPGEMEAIGFSPLAAILLGRYNLLEGTLPGDGQWQYEYFLTTQRWHRALSPDRRGTFSNWTIEEYFTKFNDLFSEDRFHSVERDSTGAATFVSMCVFAAALEEVGTVNDTAALANVIYNSTAFNGDGQIEEWDFPIVQFPPGTARIGSDTRGCRQDGSCAPDCPRASLPPNQAPEPFAQGCDRIVYYAPDNVSIVVFPMPTWQQRRCEYEGCENGGSCKPDGRCRCDLLFHGSRCELDRKVVIIPTVCVGSLFVVMIIVLSVLLRRRVRLQQKLTLAEQSYARWEPPKVRRRSTSKYVLALPQRAIDKFRSPKGGVEAQVAARLVTAPGLPHGFFSCFLSHVWASGQDQARSLKGLLQRYVKNIAVFLDVDNLEDLARLEEYVSNSSAVIVFLTGHVDDEGVAVSDYMKSNNCLVELRAAAAHARPVILLLETDPTHGGVSLETHTAACPADLLPTVLGAPVVPWHRLKDFQICSMLLLIQQLVTAWGAPGADRTIFIPEDRLRSSPLPQLQTKRSYHLYHSASNPCAAAIAADLEAQFVSPNHSGLRTTAEPEHLRHDACAAFLLYLNAETFAPGARADTLVSELEAALEAGTGLLLAHERRDGWRRLTFDEIIVATPEGLKTAGAYRRIATALHGGRHYAVSLRLLLDELDLLIRRPVRSHSLLGTVLRKTSEAGSSSGDLMRRRKRESPRLGSSSV